MIQLTDIHYGELDALDEKNNEVISTLIEAENPDLAVVTGDVVSGYAWDGETKPWFSKVYHKFADTLTKHNINWALTAGNHDT